MPSAQSAMKLLIIHSETTLNLKISDSVKFSILKFYDSVIVSDLDHGIANWM